MGPEQPPGVGGRLHRHRSRLLRPAGLKGRRSSPPPPPFQNTFDICISHVVRAVNEERSRKGASTTFSNVVTIHLQPVANSPLPPCLQELLCTVFFVLRLLPPPPPPSRVGSRNRPVSRVRGVGVKNLSLVHQQFPSNPITPT